MEHTTDNRLNTLKINVTTAMADKGFMEKLAKAERSDEIKELLTETGIEATVEQIEKIIDDGRIFGEKVINDDGELGIEALEQVAGGGPVAGFALAAMFVVAGGAMRAKPGRIIASAAGAFVIGCCAPCP